MATIQELQEQLAAAERALLEREQAISKNAAQLQVISDKEEGWLITAANPLYDGLMFGSVKFTAGLAWIHKGQEVPFFQVKPISDAALLAYPPEEQAAIREREQMPTAERCARVLAADFGYQVEYFTPDRKAEREAIVAARQDARKLAEIATAEAAKLAKLAGGR